MLLRPALFVSLEEQIIRKSDLGLYVCSTGIQERNKSLSLEVAIEEFYPQVVRPPSAIMVLRATGMHWEVNSRRWSGSEHLPCHSCAGAGSDVTFHGTEVMNQVSEMVSAGKIP